MSKTRPGYIIKMVAKSGESDSLFALAEKYIRQSGASDHWVFCRVPGEPDTLWAFEFFIDENAKAAYEGSPLADAFRDEIMALLAEPPLRIEVHPVAASWLA